MTLTPGITVLIPAYRAQGTIQRAIESVCAQTLQPAHILVIDDGSPEPLVVDAQSAAPIPVTVQRLPQNLGSSGALNHGIAQISTVWTAFLDADDSWHPEKLARQMDFAKQNPDTALVATGLRFIGGDGKIQMDVATVPLPSAPLNKLASLLEDCVMAKQSAMTKTAVLQASGGFDTTLIVGEDQEFFLRLAETHRVEIVPDILTYIHDTAGSLTKRRDLAPDFLWTQVIQPKFKAHRHKFDSATCRRIIGARTQQAAVAHLHRGSYFAALGYLWQSSIHGYQPAQNIYYALTNLPFIKALKTPIKCWIMP
jgi:glycosyltransferase involved in cell wall biosynthesis